MTLTIDLLLLVLAAICFVIAAFSLVASPRVNFIALGLLFWVLTAITP